MTRRAMFRLLLSLMLLVSQHMALAHGIAHLAGSLNQSTALTSEQGDSSDLSRAVASDPACAKCLFLAHMGAAPRSDDYRFTPALDRHDAPSVQLCCAHASSTTRAFNPRAPPFPA